MRLGMLPVSGAATVPVSFSDSRRPVSPAAHTERTQHPVPGAQVVWLSPTWPSRGCLPSRLPTASLDGLPGPEAQAAR